ncbi:dimethyl sulfoxide reductase anchor subunit family protein [Pseudogemmobacter humi]|uniref:DMSO reductase anchor subunit (DmsC) n=1 Tax=Pseudogemmobacter humi TaxID=2483812 RepID=A0A3P5XMH1_9RHOB|nr:DmsC/YnfH family molybdoenzyme membrane anchor subunit [Pseudogemmobacter humi]VDC32960.1 DMSO reductase anchor subunit (DmsC) [Pseudogemmobacter humi]
MHPAPSVILFTTLSGLGFGYLVFLATGAVALSGWAAFFAWGLGYGLAVAGLMASTFHLGNPQRALKAFTQWRSSWLSREAWTSCAALFALAPMALSDWLDLGLPRPIGWAGAVLALATVGCTAMIYTQLKTVPRWNHWTTPASFFAFALAGGAVLAGQGWLASGLCLSLGLALVLQFRLGDHQFAARGETMGSATGLGGIGPVRVFEQPHTGPNYLMREMIHVVGRRHARKLRLIALLCAALVPAVLCALLPPMVAAVTAGALHLTGALAARWLFFAEAEHVVGLYYGMR